MATTGKVQEQVLLGAWSVFTCKIDEQAKHAFEEALHDLVGVHYSPVVVSQQVVAGMNYRFFCNSKVVYPHSLNGAAIVSIYKPLQGKAHITSITPIHL
ncbi:MAG: hypothetical protein EHM93_15350 [Bacteroidales bacterium]|nr:MAG: hypothetical protein EHM93_15350 [Bacteroidales bacterium]